VGWINLAQEGKWQAIVGMVKNLQFHTMRGIYWLAEGYMHFRKKGYALWS
jgi:hypothetical protein